MLRSEHGALAFHTSG